MNILAKVREIGLDLPPVSSPAGTYRACVIEGSTAYISGQIARASDGKVVTGKVGRDISLEEGVVAARICVLNALSVMHHLIGSDRIARILKVVGYVQAADGFYEIPKVINGASDLLVKIFGDNGVHARSAVGAFVLPLNSAVEIEMTVQLR